MIIYSDVESLEDARATGKKWLRVTSAARNVKNIPLGEAFSLGDSITYTRNLVSDFDASRFVGHRRYVEVINPLNEEITVSVAGKKDLTRVQAYSDLTDREWFEGSGSEVTLPAGSFLILDIDEAAKLVGPADAEVAIYRVTVEGATFHNK